MLQLYAAQSRARELRLTITLSHSIGQSKSQVLPAWWGQGRMLQEGLESSRGGLWATLTLEFVHPISQGMTSVITEKI